MKRRHRWLRRSVIVLAGAAVGIAVIVAIQPLWAFDMLARVRPQIIWRVAVAKPLVALSFDDGPSPQNTPKVLAILARHRAHATFFLIGDRAAAHPEYLDVLRTGGHEVGNHYIGVGSALRDTDEAFVEKLTRTEEILHLQGPPKLFRPPGGRIRSSQLKLAREHGYLVVLGSAYPYDGGHPPPAYIHWIVTKNLAPGVIVILHDGIRDPSPMIESLDPILTAGDEKGFRFVTVGELLGSPLS